MHKSAKKGWVSSRRCELVLHRVAANQVIVDSDVLRDQGHHAWFLSSGDRGPCRYQGHRPRRVWLAQIVAGGLCVFRNSLDTSDCRASNVVACTFQELQRGRRRRRDAKSSYKGLTLVKGKWLVRIGAKYLGTFPDECQAAAVFDAACLARGHARNLNFPVDRGPSGAD